MVKPWEPCQDVDDDDAEDDDFDVDVDVDGDGDDGGGSGGDGGGGATEVADSGGDTDAGVDARDEHADGYGNAYAADDYDCFSDDASGVSTLQLRPHNRIICSGCSAQTFVALLPVHARQTHSAWKRRKLCNIALKVPFFLYVACLYAGISSPAG